MEFLHFSKFLSTASRNPAWTCYSQQACFQLREQKHHLLECNLLCVGLFRLLHLLSVHLHSISTCITVEHQSRNVIKERSSISLMLSNWLQFLAFPLDVLDSLFLSAITLHCNAWRKVFSWYCSSDQFCARVRKIHSKQVKGCYSCLILAT